MSEEKCFCHLNGYKVKDADAHALIAEILPVVRKLNTNYDIQIPALEQAVITLRYDTDKAEQNIEDQAAQIENNRLMAIQNDEAIEDLIDRVTTLEGAGSAGGSKMYSHNFICNFTESYLYESREGASAEFRMILSKDTAFTSLDELIAYLTAKGATSGSKAIMATGNVYITAGANGGSLVHAVQGIFVKDNAVQVLFYIEDLNFLGMYGTLTGLRNAYCTEI